MTSNRHVEAINRLRTDRTIGFLEIAGLKSRAKESEKDLEKIKRATIANTRMTNELVRLYKERGETCDSVHSLPESLDGESGTNSDHDDVDEMKLGRRDLRLLTVRL